MNALLGLANLLGGFMAGRQMRWQEQEDRLDREARRKAQEAQAQAAQEDIETSRWKRKTSEEETLRSRAKERYDSLSKAAEQAARRGNLPLAQSLANEANSLAQTHGFAPVTTELYTPQVGDVLTTAGAYAEAGIPDDVAVRALRDTYGQDLLGRVFGTTVPLEGTSPAPQNPALQTPALPPEALAPNVFDPASNPDLTPGTKPAPPAGQPTPAASAFTAPMETFQTQKPRAFGPQDPVVAKYAEMRRAKQNMTPILSSLLNASNYGLSPEGLSSAWILAGGDPEKAEIAAGLYNPTQASRWDAIADKNRSQAAWNYARTAVLPEEVAAKQMQARAAVMNAKTNAERTKALAEYWKQTAATAAYLARAKVDRDGRMLSLRERQLALDAAEALWDLEIEARSYGDDLKGVADKIAGEREKLPAPFPATSESAGPAPKAPAPKGKMSEDERYLYLLKQRGFGKITPKQVAEAINLWHGPPFYKPYSWIRQRLISEGAPRELK